MPYNDYPIEKCAAKVEELLKLIPKAKVYQKYTCDKCGQRVTCDNANMFTRFGKCGDCNHITNIGKKGCNYRVDIPNTNVEEFKILMEWQGVNMRSEFNLNAKKEV